jgi:hypothetical protein
MTAMPASARAKSASPPRLNFDIVKGRRFHQSMWLLRRNAIAGAAEHIDLSGANVRMRIYKPKFDFEVTLAHAESNREYTATVELTQEESAVIASLSTEEEKSAYAMALPAAQRALARLAQEAGLAKMPPKSDG